MQNRRGERPATLPAAAALLVVLAVLVGIDSARAAVGIQARVVATTTGVVVAVVRTSGSGYVVRTPCGASARISTATPVGRPVVVLDPGHGGDERGALSPAGLEEKAINLAVAEAAQDRLEQAGYPTVLTRTADYRVTLDVRATIVTKLAPRLFVSIHHNSVPDGPLPGPGTEAYYQHTSGKSRRLAGIVYEEVVAALRPLGGPGFGWVGDRDAGVKTRMNSRGGDYYGILRRTAGVPSVLAELAFVSNAAEADLLGRTEVQRTEGDAVARAIIRFLTTSDPGSGYVDAYPRTEPAGPGGGSGGCLDPPLE